jgi:hypothetical protein
MTDQMKQRLDALRAVTPRLNATTDEVSNIVKSVETILTDELGIGLSAMTSHFAERPGEDDVTVFEYLAYGRVNGSFRIHVVLSSERRNDEGSGIYGTWEVVATERVLWPSCSREQKLRAFTQLPELLEKLAASAEELAAAAAETAAAVKAMTGVG